MPRVFDLSDGGSGAEWPIRLFLHVLLIEEYCQYIDVLQVKNALPDFPENHMIQYFLPQGQYETYAPCTYNKGVIYSGR